MEVGHIFKKVEEVEASIAQQQMRKDRDGGLSTDDLSSFRVNLSTHNSFSGNRK